MIRETEEHVHKDGEGEECEWCGSTGDIKKNNKYYWGAVGLIILFFIILYFLAT